MTRMAHGLGVTPTTAAATCDVKQFVVEGEPAVSQLERSSKWTRTTKLAAGAAALAVLVAVTLWVAGVFSGPSTHEVMIRVGGDLGTVYRIQGAPGGDTGPMTFGGDGAERRFSIDRDPSEVDLVVTVTPPVGGSAHCLITVDGKAFALSHKSDDASGDWTCRTRK
jgi:hypothetical protein